MHIDGVIDSALHDDRADVRLLLPEPDQIAVALSAVRFADGQHIERLENVGLSLRIVSVQNIRPLGEFRLQRLVISEIGELERLNIHISSDFCSLLRRSFDRRGDSEFLPVKTDPVAVIELPAAAKLRLSVDEDPAVLNLCLCLRAGFNKAGELHRLPQLDKCVTNCDSLHTDPPCRALCGTRVKTHTAVSKSANLLKIRKWRLRFLSAIHL